MANTKITITFTKDNNVADVYTHTFPDDAALKRIIDAHQIIYAELDVDPQSNTFGQMVSVSNNQARKAMVSWAIHNWKLASVRNEQRIVSDAATQAIGDIPSNEVP